MMPKVPVVLCVSGSDPSGGAGLEADLKVLLRHGVYGMALPTLLTAQNTRGVRAIRFLDPDFLEGQWRALWEDFRPAAIKIGALGSQAMVRRVAALLRKPGIGRIPVVLDPVLGSTSGAALLEPSAFPDLARRIFPLCRIITPNAVEFARLCGETVTPENAETLLRGYARGKPFAVLLKGGHLDGKRSVDWLCDRGRLRRLFLPRLDSRNTHGTGCALASAIAARMARGDSLETACRRAKAFVWRAMATAPGLGHGRGPLNFGAKI